MYRVMSSADSDSLASSVPIWIPLQYFSHPVVAVARLPKLHWKTSYDSGYFLWCYVPCPCSLSQRKQIFTGENMMLAVKLVFYAFIKWRRHHMFSDLKKLDMLPTGCMILSVVNSHSLPFPSLIGRYGSYLEDWCRGLEAVCRSTWHRAWDTVGTQWWY